MYNENIAIKFKDKYINNENVPTKTFNSHCINIVKYSTGKIPIHLGISTGQKDQPEVVKDIIDKYKNHPSIFIIRNRIYAEEKIKFNSLQSEKLTILKINKTSTLEKH